MTRKNITTLGTSSLAFFSLFFVMPVSALTIESGSFREEIPPEMLSSWVFVDTVVVPTSLIPSEIENTAFCQSPLLCEWNLSRRSREFTAVRSQVSVDRAQVRAFVASAATRANRDPKNAVFGEDENRKVIVTVPSEDGIKLEEGEAVDAIASALENKELLAVLPAEKTAAPIQSSDIGRLGLRELLSEGVTDFEGSPANRVFNIKRALVQYQGLLIAPGEKFSFVENLGEVDGANGYLPELVIKYNKTEPEFGGGICQVSTTVFRAAINAGLKVVGRKNHAYPVSYYKPYGMDATIYIPNPDLSFINNTPNHILIQAKIDGTTLTFRFYGTKDGRTVTIDGPYILEKHPDGSMKTTFSQKVVDANGQTFIDDAFPSNYKSPSLFPKFTMLNEKPKEWNKKQWEKYLAEKESYQAKLRAAYASIPKEEAATTP